MPGTPTGSRRESHGSYDDDDNLDVELADISYDHTETDEDNGGVADKTEEEDPDNDEDADTATVSSQLNNQPEELMELNPLYLPQKYEMLPDHFELDKFPAQYKQNTAKEIRLLEYCENFRRQYAILCPDRARLLLCPLNECNVQKFVCTTLHPIHLSYPELYYWQGTARFVADYLEFVPLLPSTELPKRLLSPDTTVKLKKGTCFEYACLLTSLLLGVGYDVYVVSGYATRECCYMDETRLAYLDEAKASRTIEEQDDEGEMKRYLVKPPKDLTSQFEKACLAKEIYAQREKVRLEVERSEKEDEEAHKPPPDPLHGLRVHGWVLVLAGKRDVTEPFFIETLTGEPHPLDSPMYLGVESVWNATNFWVNMQDCSNGTAQMQYNLKDGTCWEYLLPSGSLRYNNPAGSEIGDNNEFLRGGGVGQPAQLSEHSDLEADGMHVQSTLNFELTTHDSAESSHVISSPDPSTPLAKANTLLAMKSTTTQQQHMPAGDYPRKRIASLEDKLLLMDLPSSWTIPIAIDQESYETRFPEGRKVRYYKYCKMEQFAPFSTRDGLVIRITNYNDRAWREPIDVLEKFHQRADSLLSRFTVIKTNWVTENFNHGRTTSHLAEHGYCRTQTGPQVKRYMVFYNYARVDGLQRREQTPATMKEFYVGREDRMHFREVLFGGKIKKFGPGQMAKDNEGAAFVALTSSSQLAIDKITERYSRDPEIDADEDVAECVFHMLEEKIYLTYHIGEERIAPCTRVFNKPPTGEDRRTSMQLYADTHSAFQTNLYTKPKTQVEIYNMLVHLLQKEEDSKAAVRKSESEVRSILMERTNEERKVELQVDLFDTLRNEQAHQLRLELERVAEEERYRCKEVELDYLAPFLEQIHLVDNSQQLTREQAFALREECLQDFKQRLINKANIIQTRFEERTEALQRKQQWYNLNQAHLSREDEQDYLNYCQDATFELTTLEGMLAQHKQAAPQRFMALERKLRSDPRLSEFLQVG